MANVPSVLTVLTGLALVGSPWLLGFAGDGTAVRAVVVAGTIVAVLGLLTIAEMLARQIPRSRD